MSIQHCILLFFPTYIPKIVITEFLDLIHTIHRRIEGVMDKVRNIFHDLVVSFANLFGGALTFASVAAIGWQ